MRSLLIASLGNPGAQYAHTLHSAGHTLLAALVAHTSSPPLVKFSTYAKGLVSASAAESMLFWQSPSLMNVSGPPLATAWRVFTSSPLNENPHLVILHDELELDAGRFSFKTNSGASARGHNGLKSFLAMPNMKELEFTRVGVGIGPRPKSREPDVVADFVLRKMNQRERASIEGIARDVLEKLRVFQLKD